MKKLLLPLFLLTISACEPEQQATNTPIYPEVNLDSIGALYDLNELDRNFPVPGDSSTVTILIKSTPDGTMRLLAEEVGCYYESSGDTLLGNCSSYDHAQWAKDQALARDWDHCWGPDPAPNDRWEFLCMEENGNPI